MTFAQLNARHVSLDVAHLATCEALYQGGKAVRAHISDLLPAHYLEPSEVVAERRSRALYENHVGPIIDQWVGEVWRDGARLRPADAGRMPEWLDALVVDADRRGTDLVAMFRDLLTTALVTRCGWLLVDMPAAPVGLTDRGAARAAGVDRPYLIPVKAEEVMDWEEDAQGALEWVTVKTVRLVRAHVGAARRVNTTWTEWTRLGWRRWSITHDEGKPPRDEDTIPEVAQGRHGLGIVPMVRLAVKPGLWMGDLLKEPATALFGLQSALEWSLSKAAFAVPVFQTMSQDKIRLGPGRFLTLEPGDKYGWLEPPGTSWAALDQQVQRRLEGLYRIGRQLSQAASNDSTRARSSGEAKAQDRVPTEVVLAAYGQLCREALIQVVDIARRWMKDVTPAPLIAGLDDYTGSTLDADLRRALAAITLRIPSAEFHSAMFARLAEQLLGDAPEEVLALVREQIRIGCETRGQVEDLYTPSSGDALMGRVKGMGT